MKKHTENGCTHYAFASGVTVITSPAQTRPGDEWQEFLGVEITPAAGFSVFWEDGKRFTVREQGRVEPVCIAIHTTGGLIEKVTARRGYETTTYLFDEKGVWSLTEDAFGSVRDAEQPQHPVAAMMVAEN